MNRARALIEEVAARGARIYLRDGELKFAFRGEAPTDLIEELRAHKPELLRALAPVSLEWRRDGLQPPKAVQDATAAYLEAEDGLAAWIDDKCECVPSAWEQSTDLFASWSAWAERAGEHAGTMKRFAQMLESRGYNAERRRYGRGFIGLRLAQSPAAASWNGEA
jgi:phage/plasmid-associated DNA primase